jgi:hypothetical protein
MDSWDAGSFFALHDYNSDGFWQGDEVLRTYGLMDLSNKDVSIDHGDDEYEYEIHHWELYHDENTKLEDLTHPEDIEHFRHHEEMEEAMERQDAMDQIPIVEDNIPLKFRRRF